MGTLLLKETRYNGAAMRSIVSGNARSVKELTARCALVRTAIGYVLLWRRTFCQTLTNFFGNGPDFMATWTSELRPPPLRGGGGAVASVY